LGSSDDPPSSGGGGAKAKLKIKKEKLEIRKRERGQSRVNAGLRAKKSKVQSPKSKVDLNSEIRLGP
jgi:hypothetical protein